LCGLISPRDLSRVVFLDDVANVLFSASGNSDSVAAGRVCVERALDGPPGHAGIRSRVVIRLLDSRGARLRRAQWSDPQEPDARPGLHRVRALHDRAVWDGEAERSSRRLVERRASAALWGPLERD